MKKIQPEKQVDKEISRRNLFKFMGAGFLAGGQLKNSMISNRIVKRGFTAMWTHACNLEVEYPKRLSGLSRKAFHTRLEGKPMTSNWVHFPIPTPVVGTFDVISGGKFGWKQLEYRRYRVAKIFLNFRSASVDAKVISIQLHDGPERIAEFSNLNYYGENAYKGFTLTKNPEVHQGICLSVAVEFGKNLRWIEFHSAGADFFITV